MNLKRVISAVIMMPIAILVVWYGSGNNYPWIFLAFIILISTIAILEGAKIARKAHIKTQTLLLVLTNIVIQVLMFNPAHRLKILFVLFIFICLLFVSEIIRGNPKGAFSRIGANFVILSIGGLFSLFLLLQKIQLDGVHMGHRIMLTLFAGVWGFDMFSYYGGKFAGRHKLAPAISPGKTWEGLIIGTILGWVIFVIAGQFLILNYLDDYVLVLSGLNLTHLIIAGGVVILFSLLGDLSESILKRSAGVKDSSKLIMGHGGILDRMDSLLFAVPAFLFYLLFFLDKITII
ncbi:MAG: phosphatidate cytidylyltransferase [Caldisericia bacterium]|nr:phosphatidate cytidylyltransferase [Caldisericia bacterium]